MNVPVTVWVELGFEIEAHYRRGAEPKMPSFGDEVGDPGYPAEYDIEDLSDIRFNHRKYNLETHKYDTLELSLFKHIEPGLRKIVKDALIRAIHASELDNQFFEAVQEEANT